MTATLTGILIFATFPARAHPQRSAADYCQSAQRLLETGKPLEAREAARHALEINPSSPEAECLLGRAELALGNFGAAGQDLTKALELKPDLIAARASLGTLYLKQNRLSEARVQYEVALNSNASDFQSLYGLGLVFLLDHQPGAALSQFERASRIQPDDPGILASLLQAQLQLKQETQAAATLAKLDGQLEASDPRRLEVAAMLVHEGAFKLASEQFERLQRTQPESYELNYNLALAYHRAGEEEKAAALLTHMLARRESAELECLLGDVEEARSNKSQSLEAFRRAAELESKNEEYRYDFGQALVHWGALNQALDAFSAAARDLPGSARILLGWGATYYLAGGYADSVQTLLRAADVAPQNPTVYYLLGRAYDAAGPLQGEIAKRFKTYLVAQPRDAWAEFFYGRILAARAQPSEGKGLAEAQQHLERAVVLDHGLAEAHAQLGQVLEKCEQLTAARSELELAVQLDPASSAALYQLAGLYREIGERQLAQKALTRFEELKKKERVDKDSQAIQGFLEQGR